MKATIILSSPKDSIWAIAFYEASCIKENTPSEGRIVLMQCDSRRMAVLTV